MDRPLNLPVLGARYNAALEQALDYLFEQFEPTAIVITGSIVRGDPDPASDLDIFVFHQKSWRQRIQRRFSGVPVELFVNHPAFMDGYFDEDRARGRPTTAHMLVTGHLALDTDGLMAAVIEASRRMLEAGPQIDENGLMFQRYATAMLFEDAVDVFEQDTELAAGLLHEAVSSALRFRFWQKQRWQPRDKELLSALASIDAPLAHLARRYYRARTTGEGLEIAREIVLRTTGETGAFVWESPRDPLPEESR